MVLAALSGDILTVFTYLSSTYLYMVSVSGHAICRHHHELRPFCFLESIGASWYAISFRHESRLKIGGRITSLLS
jgi:hypothetical protein